MRWYTRAEIAIGFALLAGAGLAAASAAAPVTLAGCGKSPASACSAAATRLLRCEKLALAVLARRFPRLAAGHAGAFACLGDFFRTLLGIADVYRWLGVAFRGQGLLRDIAIPATVRRRGAVCACRATALCLESLLGLGLIGVYLSLLALGATGSLTLGLGPLLAVAGGWWLLGTALKDVVLEARREADHLNVVVGFR